MSRLQQCTLLLLTTLAFVKLNVAENKVKTFNLPSPNQFLQDNCDCADQFNCQCCVEVGGAWFKQNLCANWTISADWEIRSYVKLNDATLLANTFLNRFIPPLCFPLIPTVALSACMKVHSLALHANNTLHACANASLRFIAFDFIEMLMGCVDISRNGIEVVRPEHDKMMASLMEATTASTAEISLESSNRIDEHHNSTTDILKTEFDAVKIK